MITVVYTHVVSAIYIFHKHDKKNPFFIPPSRSVHNLLEAAVTWQDIYQSGLCKFTPSFM